MFKHIHNLLGTDSEQKSTLTNVAVESDESESWKSQIALAENLVKQGKLDEALVIYRETVAQNPDKSEVYEHLSIFLRQQAEIAEAYEKLATELKRQGSIEQAANYYRQAIWLKNLTGNDTAKILKPYSTKSETSLIKVDDLKTTAFSFLPLSSSSLNESNTDAPDNKPEENNDSASLFSDPIQDPTLEQTINIDWETAQVYIQQALDCYKQQQWKQAATACQQAIEILPNMAEAYKIWGNALQRMGKTAEAMKCYSKAVEIQPNLAEVYSGIGDLYTKQQQWQEAIEYYQKAIIIKPNPQIYRSLSYVWQQVGQLEQSQIEAYKALELEQKMSQSNSSLSSQTKAIPPIDSAAIDNDLPQSSIQMYRQAATKLERQNRWQEAAICYRRALDISLSQLILPRKVRESDSLTSHSYLRSTTKPDRNSFNGNRLKKTKSLPLITPTVNRDVNPVQTEPSQLDKAIKRYHTKAILEPNSAKIHTDLGNLYARQRQWQLAIACYHRAIKIDAGCALAHLNLAKTFARLGKQEQYIEQMNLALSLDPDIASAMDWYNFGNALFEQNKQDAAISCYQQAIASKPNFERAYNRLVEILNQQNRYREAREVRQQAIDNNPEDASLYYLLGQQLEIEHQWNDAVKAYSQALKLCPRFSEASQKLNRALVQKLKLDLAVKRK